MLKFLYDFKDVRSESVIRLTRITFLSPVALETFRIYGLDVPVAIHLEFFPLSFHIMDGCIGSVVFSNFCRFLNSDGNSTLLILTFAFVDGDSALRFPFFQSVNRRSFMFGDKCRPGGNE